MDKTSLVIAVDGLSIDRETIRDEITDLTSHLFGENLCVIVSLDDRLADRVVLNSTGRKHSAIGRRASRIDVEALDEDEFRAACGVLETHHQKLFATQRSRATCQNAATVISPWFGPGFVIYPVNRLSGIVQVGNSLLLKASGAGHLH